MKTIVLFAAILGSVVREVQNNKEYYRHPFPFKPYVRKCYIHEDEDKRIKKLYENAKVVLPGLFAITEKESRSFPDLLNRFKEGEITCNKNLSMCFEEEIRRSAYTLESAPCIGKNRKTRATIANSDSSITTTKTCYKKGDLLLPNQNAVYLVDTCSATTDLQSNR